MGLFLYSQLTGDPNCSSKNTNFSVEKKEMNLRYALKTWNLVSASLFLSLYELLLHIHSLPPPPPAQLYPNLILIHLRIANSHSPFPRLDRSDWTDSWGEKRTDRKRGKEQIEVFSLSIIKITYDDCRNYLCTRNYHLLKESYILCFRLNSLLPTLIFMELVVYLIILE